MKGSSGMFKKAAHYISLSTASRTYTFSYPIVERTKIASVRQIPKQHSNIQ
jgi:hypothetical protein